MDVKTMINILAVLMIGGGVTMVIIKEKMKIDLFWVLKSKLLGGGYPAKTIVLQILTGKTYLLKFDKEKRVIKKGEEYMKSLRDKVESPPVDYSSYIPDNMSKKWMLCVETDKGERYPLKPLTNDEIFIYNQQGNILLDEQGKPKIRDELYDMAKGRSPTAIVGLKALSKGRREFYLARIEKAALKHPYENSNKGLYATIGLGIIFIVIALIIFFQAIPGIKAAGTNVAIGGAP